MSRDSIHISTILTRMGSLRYSVQQEASSCSLIRVSIQTRISYDDYSISLRLRTWLLWKKEYNTTIVSNQHYAIVYLNSCNHQLEYLPSIFIASKRISCIECLPLRLKRIIFSTSALVDRIHKDYIYIYAHGVYSVNYLILRYISH